MNKRIKVFYAVQVSNFTIKEGEPKWLLRNDACMNIAIGIISNVLEKYPDDFEFLVKLPFAYDCDDLNDLEQLFQEKYLDRIQFYREDLPVSPVTSRFNFNFAYHQANEDLLKTVDVMINDENTLTKNWRVYFDSIGKRIPIVSTNYFMDSPISPKSDPKVRYYERQMESLISSDMFSYPVQSALDEALTAYDFMFKDRKHLGKSTVWNIGAYYNEIAKGHVEKSTEKTVIYFGNRITDSAGKYTNWHLFAEAIGKLSDMISMDNIEAVMLNPTRKVTAEQEKTINELSKGYVKILPNNGKFTREEYVEFINNAHVSCNLFTNEVHGGLTHVEAMMAGCIMVAPNLNDYIYKYEDSGNLSYPFLIKTDDKKINMDDFVEKLRLSVVCSRNKLTMENYSKLNRELAYKYASYEMSCEIIVKDLKELVNTYNN